MLVSFDALAQQFAQYTDVKGKIRREVQGGRRQFPVQHVVCARAENARGAGFAEAVPFHEAAFLTFSGSSC